MLRIKATQASSLSVCVGVCRHDVLLSKMADKEVMFRHTHTYTHNYPHFT